MAKKSVITFEDNFDIISKAVEAAPKSVMKQIGQQIARETRNKLDKRTGRLRKSVGYWARKNEGDLQIGYYNNYLDSHKGAAFYKEAVMADNNPLVEVVRNNQSSISKLIGEALAALGFKDKAYIDRMIGSVQDEQGE